MINLDFSLAVSGYTALVLISILLAWLMSKKEKNKDLSLQHRFIWHCAICTYTYINTKDDAISLCPRCGSYNKKTS